MSNELSGFLNGDLLFESFKGSLVEADSPYDLSGLKIQYPVSYSMEAYKVEDGVELDITIDYKMETSCSRCLMPVQEEIHDKYHVKVVLGEVEEDITNEDVIQVKNMDEFPLEELVFSQVVASIPMKSLCKDNCKGLCPTCGQDLNLGQCNCGKEIPKNQFAVLKGLFTENKEV